MILSKQFDDALRFAADRHRDHPRKGTAIPYISHLLGVASIAIEHGADEDEAIGALLHDAVEDGKATLAEIQELFGDAVAEIVAGCSATDVDPKPWQERKNAYISHIATASSSTRLVSASDKLHNARAILRDYRDIGEGLWTRFNATREQILWYYRGLVDAFRAFGPSPLIDELDRVVTELERMVRAAAPAPKPES